MLKRGGGLASVVRNRTEVSPERTVYTWLADGQSVMGSLSFAAIDLRARTIAAHLQTIMGRQERALLLYRPGLDFIAGFLGCVYASVIAVPAYAVRNVRQQRGIEGIAKDSKPTAILTTSNCVRSNQQLLLDCVPKAVRWLATDCLDESAADSWKSATRTSKDILYLQYTSGSTAEPKGVMITDSNLLENLAYIASSGEFGSDANAVTWLPHFHDMGLVYGWLQPIFSCFHAYHMAPASFTQSPIRWLKAISTLRGTHCGGPNFAFDLCCDRISPEERDDLDLSSWGIAFTGAEPVHGRTLERFAEFFGPCGFRRSAFYPVYGLAEATLKVTSVQPGSGPLVCSVDSEALRRNEIRPVEGQPVTSQKLVGCGGPGRSHQIAIVDPLTGVCSEPGKIGEIWVSGSSVARGYWNRPEETRRTFRARLAGDNKRYYLRTGDLGSIHSGQLLIVGRMKDVIIIRGDNYYPQDIEATVEASAPGIRRGTAVAFGVTIREQECLVIVAEVTSAEGHDLAGIADLIRRSVGEEHELWIYAIELLPPGSLHRTTSGKLQRNACRTLFVSGLLNPIYRSRREDKVSSGTRTVVKRHELLQLLPAEREIKIEAYLMSEISRLISAESSDIDPADVPTSLGVDSLMATELAHNIEQDLEIDAGATLILGGGDIQAIASMLSRELQEPASLPLSMRRTGDEDQAEFPLSFEQRAFWFLQSTRPQSTAWNITRGVKLCGNLEEPRFRRAIQQVVERHPALRTTFRSVGGAAVQCVHPSQEPWLEFIDASQWKQEAIRGALKDFASQPFRLSDRPPFRVQLWRISRDVHFFLISIHHIIADLWALSVLWREIFQLYDDPGKIPPPPANTVQDFVRWQQDLLSGPRIQVSRQYWEQLLTEPLPNTTLVRDPSATMAPDRACGRYIVRLTRGVNEAVKLLASERRTTPFSVLLSAFLVLLHRETYETDLVIGTPVHGRSKSAFRDIVGCFINTVPIRIDLSANPVFEEVLRRVSKAAAAAMHHSTLPFPLMVERLRGRRDASLSPVVRVLLMYYGAALIEGMIPELAVADEGGSYRLRDLSVEVLDVRQPMTQFDLMLTIVESSNGQLAAHFEYDAGQFEAAAIREVAVHFETLLKSIVEAPAALISDLAVLTSGEEERLLRDWNSTGKSRPESSLCVLLADQASATPDAVAVSFEETRLTYEALHTIARRIASQLRSRFAIGPDSTVGICCDRSLELITALLGILEAGGAYVPLDPEYPGDRLQYMLMQSGASILLCQPQYTHRFKDFPRVVSLDDWCNADIVDNVGAEHIRTAEPENLAYVIFTSGSTGRPKGVMITHSAICNRLLWMKEHYDVGPADVILHKTPITFDVSVWELFLPLISGARLEVVRPGGHRDPGYVAAISRKEQVTTVHFIPRMLHMTAAGADLRKCTALRNVICSGEILSRDVQDAFFESSSAALHNLYGPTEAAVDVSAWKCMPKDRRLSVPIGRPISNTCLYVLDRNMKPTPVGVPGELFIGGVALARGYVGRSDLTATSFVPDSIGAVTGGRLYHTGDLARYDSEGNLRFLARIDNQVKIRGLRVETGEIEAILGQQPGVRESAVLLESTQNGEELVAYVVLMETGKPTGRALRVALANSLPDYMLPAKFVSIPRLPLSPNGKLDRSALPSMSEWHVLSLQDTDHPLQPLTPTETRLMEIWSRLLGEDIRSIHDNFFALGGHSLLAVRMTSEVREDFGVELPLESLLTSEGTIATVAAAIDGLMAGCMVVAQA